MRNASPSRIYLLTIALQSILAGALLWIGGLTWGSINSDLVTQELTGSVVNPFIFAVWAVCLAVVIGVLATRTWGRRILGTLGAVVCAAGIYSLIVLDKDGLNALWFVSILLCGGLMATNVLTLVVSKNWPTLGGKYSRSAPPEQDAWALLDAGVDPTLESDPENGRPHD